MVNIFDHMPASFEGLAVMYDDETEVTKRLISTTVTCPACGCQFLTAILHPDDYPDPELDDQPTDPNINVAELRKIKEES